MRVRLTGFVLALLPIGWWAWELRDPCGLQGDAWRQCWAHHQGEHRGTDRDR